MAGVLQWLGALLLLQQFLLTASAPVTPCKSTDDAGAVRLHLHLTSHVNATGHRLLVAQVQSAGAPDQRVELDVTQRESELNASGGRGGGRLLTLDTAAAVVGEARAAERAVERGPERVAERVSERAPSRAPERVPERASERAPERVPERAPERGPEILAVNRVRKGAVPDGDFEEVPYTDYRPLEGLNVTVKGLYKVHARARTWPEARAACQAEYAQLLVAETAAEAAAAARAFARGPAPAAAHRADLFFVGLSDEQREGHYVTVTGKNLTSLEFQSWHAKEPSKGREQNYVALDKEGNLHDIPNSWKLAFMCEALPF